MHSISTESSDELPTKKSKLFSFLEENQSDTNGSGSREFPSYLDDSGFEKNVNPLKFWKANQSRYPTLSKIARIYLGVLATSAPVERVFSHARNIMRPDRSRLLPKNFENLVFLKVNMNLM